MNNEHGVSCRFCEATKGQATPQATGDIPWLGQGSSAQVSELPHLWSVCSASKSVLQHLISAT